MASTPPTGTVTFLFTDIEGSTKLWESYPARMREVLERHNEILRSAVEDHDGHVFKTVGDAFCATFSHPRKALRAALTAQRALFAERWGKPVRSLKVRMALHTGYAELERDGDYFGPAVNRVARLISLAYGGQVLLSGTTHDQVRDHPGLVDEQARLVELGEHRLKDLTRPERVSQLAVPGLLERFSPPLREEAPEEEERYRIKSFLGSGGFAKVYLAHDEELDQEVAYKVLAPRHDVDEEEFVERFKREAKNAAKLRAHPNVVPVYDRGEKEDGTYYMVMEYLPGGTLEDVIARQGPLPARRALQITLQVARALSEAHEQGVIHRDIKPENVLLTKWGDAKVADFGIAKAAEAATRLTRTGFNPGTVHYMAPEQARGEEATSSSDLYALGVVLYKMLAGKLPFEGKTVSEIQNKHLHERVRPLEEINPNANVPERVEAVTLRLLAKDPNERYPNASVLIDELEQVLRSLEEDGGTRLDKTRPPSAVEVPDLAGQDILLANEMLANRGLKLGDQEEVPSKTVPEGQIMGQTPEAGTEVEPDSLVSVTVSLGPEEDSAATIPGDTVPPSTVVVEVPDLTGRNASQARSMLVDAGLRLGDQEEVYSDAIPEGEIIGQSPEAGTEVEVGSLVSVTVSFGPERQDRWKRKEVLGAVAAVVAGAGWLFWGAYGGSPFFDPLSITVFIIALIGTLGGLVGLHARQATSYGRRGLAGFLAAFAGTTLWLVGAVLISDSLGENFDPSDVPVGYELGFLGIIGGFVLLVGGFVLLGTATLRARALPRWCGLLLIVGIVGLPETGSDGRITYGGTIVLGLVWLALGYALWSRRAISPDRRSRPEQAEPSLGAVDAVVAGVAWIVSGILSLLLSEEYLLLAIGMVIIALTGTLGGLIDLHTRQATSYGKPGLAGFLAAFVGTTLGLVGFVLDVVDPSLSPGSSLSLLASSGIGVGSVLSGVGFVLLGIATLRARVLPRWCGLLLIVGIVGFLDLAYASLFGGWIFGIFTVLDLGGTIVLGLVWLALGYALWSRRAVTPDRQLRPEQAEPSRRWAVAMAMIFSALGIFGSVGWYFLGTYSTVPDLRGKTISEAAEIAGTDFTTNVLLVEASEQPKGRIIDQIPKPDERVSRGWNISVIFSGGQERVEVPDVSGLSESQAKKVLIDAGLDTFGILKFDRNGEPKEEHLDRTVTATDPPAGRVVDPGTDISTRTR